MLFDTVLLMNTVDSFTAIWLKKIFLPSGKRSRSMINWTILQEQHLIAQHDFVTKTVWLKIGMMFSDPHGGFL